MTADGRDGTDHTHEASCLRSFGGREKPPRFSPREARQAKRLAIVTAIVGAFFTLELVGALVARSVVLQADALHLFTDVMALGFSLLAMRLAVRRATPPFTFGLRRAEPVAGLLSAVLVLLSTTLIVAEGAAALRVKTQPRGSAMLVFAGLAIVVNGISAWLLHDVTGARGHDRSEKAHHGHVEHGHVEHVAHVAPPAHHGHGHALNLRGATLHLLGDALGAAFALVAAVIIRLGGPPQADPIAGFVVAFILLVSAVRLMTQAALVLLEAAPAHLPVASVRACIEGLPGVLGVHELHVWTLGAGHDAVTVHVVASAADASLGALVSSRLRREFGAEYVTVQIEVARSDPGPP